MLPLRFLRALCLLGLVVINVRCGSSPAPEPKSTVERETTVSDDSEEAEEESSSAAEGASDDAPPPRQPCDDGSCFACGAGFCPAGFYCDESAQGGPGCAWLPACAPAVTCACLETAFSGCACSERGGAPHLSCN